MANSILGSLRAFAQGSMTESALRENTGVDTGYDFENDEQFMQECMQACLPTMMQMMIMDENAELLDEDVKDAMIKVTDYFVGQGMLSEAATVSLSNPKINVVRLNKQAQINRLTTIITLKMARKAKSKNYTKYKMGQKIKKTNMEEMHKKYGAKAERLAKKLYAQMQKHPRAAAVAESKKKSSKK